MYHTNPQHKHFPESHQQDDSLDEQPEEPQQYLLQPHQIELTFKKPQTYLSHAQQHNQEHSRNLFTSSERNIIQHLQQPISTYFNLTIDQLSQLPFADLYSLQLSDKQQKKLVLVGDILQLKRVRMKAKMVRVNQSCLMAKQKLSYEQKNKLYLLDLLLKQLSKKQVVNTLHLNLKLKKFLSQYGDEEHENKQESLSNPQIRMQSGYKEQIKYNVSYEQQSRQAQYEPSKDEGEIDRSAIRDKIWIMSQTLSAIIMKTMFSSFNSIRNCSKKNQRTAIAKASSTSFQISSIKNHNKDISVRSQDILLHDGYQSSAHLPPVKSKEEAQHIQQDRDKMEEAQQDEQAQEENQFKASETQVQLGRLQDYIDQLIEECSQSNDLQKKYFIKWKIFLLQKIAISIISNYRAEQEPQQSENQLQHTQQLQKQHQQQNIKQLQHQSQSKSRNINAENSKSELSIIEGWSRATSQLSQPESNLKPQKNQLRLLLFNNRATQLLSLLRKNKQQHQIQAIVDRVYERKTLMLVFSAIKSHYEDQQMRRELDGYYQEVAENQQDDTDLPFFFWKTTQLHKYFKLFKENTRNNHLDRTLQRFIIRYSFSTILNFSRKQLRLDERINKWVEMREKTNLFRYFNTWKQDYKINNSYSAKVKSYLADKNKDMLRYYFSVLKLQFKKKLVSINRADRYYSTVLKQRVFRQIKLLTYDSHIFRDKESALNQHLYYRNTHIFMHKFVDYYAQYTDYQRIIAKQQRLSKLLLDRTIAQTLRNWRTAALRKNAYLTIQQKLLRLNRKKKKREILKQWKNRMTQRRGLQMQRSDKHKQWLVKYYSDLCSVVTP